MSFYYKSCALLREHHLHNRERIRKKISDLVDSISSMEEKSQRLASGGKNMGTAEAEVFADQIDEEIHKFQYNLDHCRRYSTMAPRSTISSAAGD